MQEQMTQDVPASSAPFTAAEVAWQQANYRCVMAAIATITQRLEQRIASLRGQPVESAGPVEDWQAIAAQMAQPPALKRLTQRFGLSDFERDLLVLCTGMEVGGNWDVLCGTAQGNSQRAFPTFELAQAILPAPHWSAFLPASPLRHWQLLTVGLSQGLLVAPLRLDERILHELLGFSRLDDRLEGLVTEVTASDYLVTSHQTLVAQIATAWQQARDRARLPLLQLFGPDRHSQREIATAACRRLGYRPYLLSSRALPTNLQDLQQFIRLWEREVVLSDVALLLDWDRLEGSDRTRDNAIALLRDSIASPLLLLSRDRIPSPDRPALAYAIRNPTRQEQIHLWQSFLVPANAAANGTIPSSEGNGSEGNHSDANGFVQTLANQFDLTTNQIQAASLQAQTQASNPETSPADFPALWSACRLQARPQLDDLAQRLNPKETWDDLILPDSQKQLLQEIVTHVQQRSQVYNDWGFSQRSSRGLGISALFSGISGTGKTMAAGVLAQTLQLDLYRIDLSSVVSKYIGETEKNLRRIFDAADSGGVILLFDEADALFGKRSDVKDSHDRYANMEVSYLLQRIEAYRGLAILTTNLKDAIDAAFLRRIRFIVRFPFPDYAQRIEIWRHILPAAVPTQDLNYRQLAKLNVAGGVIRNIALGAAFLAASAGSPLTMKHLLGAAQREFAKLERTLPPSEVRGWVAKAESS